MLDEIKQSYYENANALDGWKKKTGNELCFLYKKYKDENNSLLDNCLSAIIYKFWSVATKGYYSQGLKLASQEDCYNWLIDSIQYVLEHHVWDDENHKLYKDKKAPEKAINVVFNSTKINYFVAQTRQKRKIDATSLSLDGISEDVSDAYFLPVYDKYNLSSNELEKYISDLYHKYEYFNSICLDLILNEDVIDDSFTVDSTVKTKYNKLKTKLKNLDDRYSELFSCLYNIDVNDVRKSVDYIKTLDSSTLDIKINRFLLQLRQNEFFKKMLKE